MKLRNIFAGIAAAAIAVSAMAVSASAVDVTYPDFSESDEWGSYMDMVKMYPDVANVATCEITITDTEANGCVVVAANSNGWGWNPVDSAAANGDGTFTYSVPCALDASDDFVKITVQDWDESTLAEVCKIVLKDASGNVLFEAPAGGGAAAEPATLEATENDAPAVDTSADTTTTGTDTTTAPATGNVAVASVAAVMGLAGVAMIASRKRK